MLIDFLSLANLDAILTNQNLEFRNILFTELNLGNITMSLKMMSWCIGPKVETEAHR